MQPYKNVELLQVALAERGYRFKDLLIDDNRYAVFVSPQNATWFTHYDKICYPFTSGTVKDFSKSKSLMQKLATHYDIQNPETEIIARGQSIVGAYRLLEKYQKVVVKQNAGSLSKDVFLNITDKQTLEHTINDVLTRHDSVLVQEQFEGEEYRFTVIEGKTRSVLLRQRPMIIGDGIHTVQDLLHIENNARSQIVVPYLSYPQLTSDLIDASYFENSHIPMVGEKVILGQATMIMNGASVYESLSSMNPEYCLIAEKLAQNLGAPFLAVDMLLKDMKKCPDKDSYRFIETNTAPVLKMYYSCRDGQHFDAMSYLLPLIDKYLHFNQST